MPAATCHIKMIYNPSIIFLQFIPEVHVRLSEPAVVIMAGTSKIPIAFLVSSYSSTSRYIPAIYLNKSTNRSRGGY